MLSRRQIIVILMVIATGTMVTSCKHDGPDEGSEVVEPAIEGVAVRPMPVMDAPLAERILREGPVSATADITREEDAVGEVAESGAEIETDSVTSSRYDPNT